MGGFEKRMSCWDGLKVDSVWIHKRRKPQEAQPRDSEHRGVMAGLQETL